MSLDKETLIRKTANKYRYHEILHEIGNERRRQFEEEGHTPEIDDQFINGQLADAAACYTVTNNKDMLECWPVDFKWNPKNRRRDLIRAAALIIAEIERLDRILER